MEHRIPRPRLIILSTGGTIAMTKEPAQGGAAMTLCAANLVGAVPRLADLAEVEALDVLAKPSADFTLADIAAIADAATAAAKTGAGIVITRLAGYLQALPPELRREGGADTVFHNRMAHLTHEVPGTIVENDVHVATMGITPPGTYVAGADGLIRTADGRLPAILHQYDRVPDIARVVAARYRLPG